MIPYATPSLQFCKGMTQICLPHPLSTKKKLNSQLIPQLIHFLFNPVSSFNIFRTNIPFSARKKPLQFCGERNRFRGFFQTQSTCNLTHKLVSDTLPWNMQVIFKNVFLVTYSIGWRGERRETSWRHPNYTQNGRKNILLPEGRS